MANIIQLPNDLIEKIAAGEVIERPASVVKELVENAIDAKATAIEVEVEKGGKSLIRVSDNGCGMDGDDLLLAFARHATSKISAFDDLFAIHTLGFRGEALAAISTVSQVTATTRSKDSDLAWTVTCTGTTPENVQETSGAPGTVFEIRNLFFNIPARRKFLRSDSAEMARISDVITELSLGHPNISFQLTHNNRLVVRANAASNIKARIGELMGSPTADELLELAFDDGFIKIHGYVSRPENAVGAARAQYYFLNNRAVRDKLFIAASRQAHDGYLERGKHPQLFLFMTIDPAEVDVNVHPTKREVRFAEGSRVYRAIREAILEALSSSDQTPKYEKPTGSERSGHGQPRADKVRQAVSEFFSRPQPKPHQQLPGLSSRPHSTGQFTHEAPYASRAHDAPRNDVGPSMEQTAAPAAPQGPAVGRTAIQIHSSYILYETETGFAVVDQHALHERIMLEQIHSQLNSGMLPAQKLMHPIVFDVVPGEKERIIETVELLKQLGFYVEPFGPHSVGIFAIPQLLKTGNAEGAVREIAEKASETHGDVKASDVLDKAAHSLACHGAIKAGDPLSQSEIDALLAHKESADNASRCAHGRPTALDFPISDLEKKFNRR